MRVQFSFSLSMFLIRSYLANRKLKKYIYDTGVLNFNILYIYYVMLGAINTSQEYNFTYFSHIYKSELIINNESVDIHDMLCCVCESSFLYNMENLALLLSEIWENGEKLWWMSLVVDSFFLLLCYFSLH